MPSGCYEQITFFLLCSSLFSEFATVCTVSEAGYLLNQSTMKVSHPQVSKNQRNTPAGFTLSVLELLVLSSLMALRAPHYKQKRNKQTTLYISLSSNSFSGE